MEGPKNYTSLLTIATIVTALIVSPGSILAKQNNYKRGQGMRDQAGPMQKGPSEEERQQRKDKKEAKITEMIENSPVVKLTEMLVAENVLDEEAIEIIKASAKKMFRKKWAMKEEMHERRKRKWAEKMKQRKAGENMGRADQNGKSGNGMTRNGKSNKRNHAVRWDANVMKDKR